jgi:DNA-directed RNA polymerase specialized sigma24 family protein
MGDVRVEDENGAFLGFADETTARELIAAGLVSFEGGAQRCVRRKVPGRGDLGSDPMRGGFPSPFERIVAQERRRLVAEWCERLTGRQRYLIRLRYHHDLTFYQIGMAMRISDEAAMKMHRRALDELEAQARAAGIHGLKDV